MLRVVVVGLGPIGIACARAVADEADMELVGLIDTDPAKVGKRIADLVDPTDADEDDQDITLRVAASLTDALGDRPADLAMVTTTSRFERLAPTLTELLARRIHIVTSCEEMAWPAYRHPDLARDIDAQAKAAGCAVLGTGVNPGFVMDSLAVTLSCAVRRVTSVRCVRRVDARLRRLPLQKKVGALLTVEEFRAKAGCRKLGHQGLAESVALLAAGLGHTVAPGEVDVELEPVIADRPLPSGLGLIEPGRVAGIHNTARWTSEALTIELDLTMAVGVSDAKDVIELGGPVPVRFKVSGGLPGDSATVAILLNTGRVLPRLAPGLKTMLDLPPAGACGRDR